MDLQQRTEKHNQRIRQAEEKTSVADTPLEENDNEGAKRSNTNNTNEQSRKKKTKISPKINSPKEPMAQLKDGAKANDDSVTERKLKQT